MDKRNEILKNIGNADDKVLGAKIIDLIEQVQKYYEPRFTQFLDPAQIRMARNIVEKYSNVVYSITCGIKDCERNIIAIYPDYIAEDDIKIPACALCIRGKSKFENLNHRDVLGAIMNLGIKREKIGDIIIGDDRCYIIIYNDISRYIMLNLARVKHTSVEVDQIDFESVPDKRYEFKEVASNVASLRLDSVLSCGFGESRSSISREITRGNVKVNWEEATDLSYMVSPGDVISLRGKGRIILDRVSGKTKKGRVNIIIKRII